MSAQEQQNFITRFFSKPRVAAFIATSALFGGLFWYNEGALILGSMLFDMANILLSTSILAQAGIAMTFGMLAVTALATAYYVGKKVFFDNKAPSSPTFKQVKAATIENEINDLRKQLGTTSKNDRDFLKEFNRYFKQEKGRTEQTKEQRKKELDFSPTKTSQLCFLKQALQKVVEAPEAERAKKESKALKKMHEHFSMDY